MKSFFVDERGHLCNDRNSTDVLFCCAEYFFEIPDDKEIRDGKMCTFNRLGKGADMSSIIFHIDVNSAYLSWTAVEN